jgi:hypothetical protein
MFPLSYPRTTGTYRSAYWANNATGTLSFSGDWGTIHLALTRDLGEKFFWKFDFLLRFKHSFDATLEAHTYNWSPTSPTANNIHDPPPFFLGVNWLVQYNISKDYSIDIIFRCMRIENEVKLDFRNVLIRPKRTTFIRVSNQLNNIFGVEQKN